MSGFLWKNCDFIEARRGEKISFFVVLFRPFCSVLTRCFSLFFMLIFWPINPYSFLFFVLYFWKKIRLWTIFFERLCCVYFCKWHICYLPLWKIFGILFDFSLLCLSLLKRSVWWFFDTDESLGKEGFSCYSVLVLRLSYLPDLHCQIEMNKCSVHG